MENIDNFDFFNEESFEYLNNLIITNISILKKSDKYNEIKKKISSLMDYFDNTLNESDKEKFEELIKLFYDYEGFIQALTYMFGVKFHKNLSSIKKCEKGDRL